MPPLPSDYYYGSETEGGGFEQLPHPAPAPVAQPGPQTRSEQATSQAGAQTKTTGGTGASKTAPGGTAPRWIYAVNTPGDPDWGQMQANGTGLVVASDDPQAQEWVDKARAHGVPVAVNVAARGGETPEQYAAEVAAAKSKWNPDLLVLDVEGPGKGYAPGDPRYNAAYQGWTWSQQAAPLAAAAAGGTQTVVTMEPQQDDYNYGAWTGIGSNVWVQAYHGDMSAVDPDAVRAQVVRNGVDPSRVTVIVGPGQNPGSGGGWVSYGYGPQRQTGGTGRPPTGNPPPGANPISDPGVNPGATPTPTPDPGHGRPPGGTNPGGTTQPPPPANADADTWISYYFSQFGLPSDLIKDLEDLAKKYPNDPGSFLAAAKAYLRTTPWYAQHFPGIEAGVLKGILSDVNRESDYLAYVNQVSNLFRQYWGRDVSSSEISSYLTEGLDVGTVQRRYQGLANVIGQGQDWTYLLGAFSSEFQNPDMDVLRALGDQQAGLDSALGQRVSRAMQQALGRYQSAFRGSAATPSLSLQGGRLSAPSLTQNATPDIPA